MSRRHHPSEAGPPPADLDVRLAEMERERQELEDAGLSREEAVAMLEQEAESAAAAAAEAEAQAAAAVAELEAVRPALVDLEWAGALSAVVAARAATASTLASRAVRSIFEANPARVHGPLLLPTDVAGRPSESGLVRPGLAFMIGETREVPRYDATGLRLSPGDTNYLTPTYLGDARGPAAEVGTPAAAALASAYYTKNALRGTRLPAGSLPTASRIPRGEVASFHLSTTPPTVHGALTTQKYEPTAAVHTTGQFASVIADALAQARAGGARPLGVRVAFAEPTPEGEQGEGRMTYRTLTGTTPEQIQAELERINAGVPGGSHAALERMLASPSAGRGDQPAKPSDPINEGYEPRTDHFYLQYTQDGAGATPLSFQGVSTGKGPPHAYFDLVDLAKHAEPGDCLIAVVRAVAKARGVTPVTSKAPTIRRQLKLPPGDIVASHENFERLGTLFGLRIRLTTGVAACPDNLREFDDDGARETERNRCVHAPAKLVVEVAGGPENAPDCLVYIQDNHYWCVRKVRPFATCPVTGDLITDEKRQRTTAHLTRRVLEQNRVWYGVKPRQKVKARDRLQLVIAYDYETVYLPDGRLVPYALGFTTFDPAATDGDFAARRAEVTLSYIHSPPPGDEEKPLKDRLKGLLWRAQQVSEPLIRVLQSAPAGVDYTLISFNGVRFDHFILAQALLKHNLLHTRSIFATSEGIRRIAIKVGDSCHSTLDLAKIVTGMSLDAACKAFVTSPVKVEGFSHDLPQMACENYRLSEWIAENAEKLNEYLSGDVLSLASLYVKLAAGLREIAPGLTFVGPKAVQTAGSIAWTLLTQRCPLPRACADGYQDAFVRSAITGGRVQSYESRAGEPVVEEGPLRMVDFASMYPAAMAAQDKIASLFDARVGWGLYPTGPQAEPQAVEEYVPGTVGVYEVVVHSQPSPAVLPQRSDDAPLNWRPTGVFRTVATHCDIELIRGAGGEVEVLQGFAWQRERCTRTLFRAFVEEIVKLKNQQDEWKKTAPVRYNPALRELYKLILNSASGKCAQRNYEDVCVLAQGRNDQLAAEQAMREGHPVVWTPLAYDACLLVGKKPKDAVYRRATAKPSILAVLIYSYSRAMLWRTILQHHCLYSDTDSGLLRLADYEALRAAFPTLDPTGRAKELGDLEEELRAVNPGEDAFRAYLMAPKDYAVFKLANSAPEPGAKHKLRLKGVNQRRDRLVLAGAEERLSAVGLRALAEEYRCGSSAVSVRLCDDPEQFLRRRVAGERVLVLCSQLTRSVTGGEGSPFQLAQRFLLKRFLPGAADGEELDGGEAEGESEE